MEKQLIFLSSLPTGGRFRQVYRTPSDDIADIFADNGCHSATIMWKDGSSSHFSGAPYYFFCKK